MLYSTLVDVYAETAAPVLAASTPCGTVPQVVLPSSDGVTYSTSYDEPAGAWQVGATFAAGYLDDGDQVTAWTLPAIATPCPTTPAGGGSSGGSTPGATGLTELPDMGAAPAGPVLVLGGALAVVGSIALVVDGLRRRTRSGS